LKHIAVCDKNKSPAIELLYLAVFLKSMLPEQVLRRIFGHKKEGRMCQEAGRIA
jgi:hypothetical protein